MSQKVAKGLCKQLHYIPQRKLKWGTQTFTSKTDPYKYDENASRSPGPLSSEGPAPGPVRIKQGKATWTVLPRSPTPTRLGPTLDCLNLQEP